MTRDETSPDPFETLSNHDLNQLAKRIGVNINHVRGLTRPTSRPARWVAQIIAESVGEALEVVYPQFANGSPYGEPHPRGHLMETAQ